MPQLLLQLHKSSHSSALILANLKYFFAGQDFSGFFRTPLVFSKHTSNIIGPTPNIHHFISKCKTQILQDTYSRICRTAGYLRQKSRTVLQKAGRLTTMCARVTIFFFKDQEVVCARLASLAIRTCKYTTY